MDRIAVCGQVVDLPVHNKVGVVRNLQANGQDNAEVRETKAYVTSHAYRKSCHWQAHYQRAKAVYKTGRETPL